MKAECKEIVEIVERVVKETVPVNVITLTMSREEAAKLYAITRLTVTIPETVENLADGDWRLPKDQTAPFLRKINIALSSAGVIAAWK